MFVIPGSVRVNVMAVTDLKCHMVVASSGSSKSGGAQVVSEPRASPSRKILSRILSFNTTVNSEAELYASVAILADDAKRAADEPTTISNNALQQRNTTVYSVIKLKDNKLGSPHNSDGLIRLAEEFLFHGVYTNQTIQIAFYCLLPNHDEEICVGITKIPLSRLNDNSKVHIVDR